MGRLLDEAVTVDPTAGVHRLPQPFRMIDKILSDVVDDAADKAVARERRRLARLGIVEGTKMYRPVAETAEFERAATCVCVARFEDDEDPLVSNANANAENAEGREDPTSASKDEDANAKASTSRPNAVVFAGDEDGRVLAVDAASGAVLGRVVAFPGRAIAAVTAATVAPPPPEDEAFWRAGETTVSGAAATAPSPDVAGANVADEDAKEESDAKEREDDDDRGAGVDPSDPSDPSDPTDPSVPLFDIAAAAGGPTPRDATPAMFVAAACADAVRVYAFDASASRFAPLCAAAAPAGSTPVSLRLAPDGRTLALAAGGGALAAYEVPPPKPEAFLGAGEADAGDDAAAAEEDGDGGRETNENENEDGTAGDGVPDQPEAETLSGSEEEGKKASSAAQTHDDAAFAAATPLVWLAAARAAAAFGAAPLPEAPGAEGGPGGDDADVSPEDEAGGDAEAAGAETAREHADDAEAESRSGASEAATAKVRRDSRASGAPDVYFRLDGARRADALLAAWPGRNRAAMFSVRGAPDALAVSAHRHDAVPCLRGERDPVDPVLRDPVDDETAEAAATAAEDAAATPAAAEATTPASAASSTPACDWTTPFPVTAAAAVSDGAFSLFALGLVDGTVLVLDARLGTVAARLDRLSAVAPPARSPFPSLADDATEETRRTDGARFGAGSGGAEKPRVVPSLTACVALAFLSSKTANETASATTVELAAASAEGWTATFPFPVVSGKAFPKNPPASRVCAPRGAPHVAASLAGQRGGPFVVVEGDAPDEASSFGDASEASEADGAPFSATTGEKNASFRKKSASEPERDDDDERSTRRTFVRLMDVTGASDLYGVFCPPERCAFALDARGRTMHCFDGSGTAVVVARERRETARPVAEAEPESLADPAAPPRGEGDGEEDSEDAADAEDSEAAKPPSVTHTTHTKLCVYAVPRDAPTGAAAGFSPPETPASSPAYRERAQFSFSLDGRVASETGSPKRSPPFAPKLVEALDDPPSRRSQTSASARRLARILNSRGGPAARRERFPKRLAELERKFERRAAEEGGRPPPAPLGAY